MMIDNIDFGFKPSIYQEKIFNFIQHGNGNAVISAKAGSGKCLGKDTEILMYDGSVKKVQDIVVGDKLMGDDSKPRNVLTITKGYGELKKIIPKKGDPWICNDAHILTLSKYRQGWKTRKSEHITIDVSINDIENGIKVNNGKHPDNFFRKLKLLKTGVDFKFRKVDFDPWLYGIWLGDGTNCQSSITNADKEIIDNISKVLPDDLYSEVHFYKNKAPKISIKSKYGVKPFQNRFSQFIRNESINEKNEKYINKKYLINSRKNRLKLLAGLIDSVGYYTNNTYYISTKFESLSNDILFLARSLGFGAYCVQRNNTCCNNGKTKPYYHITINGDLKEVPVVLERKKATERKICKNPLHVGFKIEDYGYGDYYGFTLDGNGRFLLSDFTITHNTSTCVASIKLINPKKNVMFLAFNKSIAEELNKKLYEYKNVDVKTSHSLGYSIIKRNVEGDVEVSEYKYRTYLKQNINELSDAYEHLSKKQFNVYLDNITSLIEFSRFNLAQTSDEVKQISVKYDIPLLYDECDVVIKILEWGKTELNHIDYTDMVWLPVELSMNPRGFQKDFIYVDEGQDQSLASIQLFLKCAKRGTRFIFVADEKQMINTFAGSSEDAFQFMKDYPKTTSFELPICYRCPKSVVELAQTLVPEIKYQDNVEEGTIQENCHISDLKNGDMVLCRSKAPLLNLYTKLLRQNKQCYIKGQEFGNNLKKLLESVDCEQLNSSLKEDGVFIQLYDNLFEMRNKIMDMTGLDYQDATLSNYVTERFDMINALTVLSERYKVKTELLHHIDEIFDETKDGIILSTIHKAKGLEADNVYILCHSSMPSKLAKKQWEKDTEQNLIYVAYTRAKHKLGFISEKEVKPFGISQGTDAILNELGLIENTVCRVLGKIPREEKDSIEVARFNLNNGITNIQNIQIDNNFKVINTNSENSRKDNNEDILSELDELLNM